MVGGLDPRYEKRGWGCVSALGPIQKRGGGGCSLQARYEKRRGEGGGGVCCTLQAQFERGVGGGGLLSG